MTKEMTLASLLKNYANYNLWANEKLVDWLKTKPCEKMDQEVASSFPSIKKTLLHIWATERFWLSVIQHIPPAYSFTNDFDGSIEDVFEGIIDNSEQIALYVDSLHDNALLEDCTLDTPWVKGTRPVFDFIHHLLNHSTYHRGQVVTIGRNVGLTDAPMTDYNFYNFMEDLAVA